MFSYFNDLFSKKEKKEDKIDHLQKMTGEYFKKMSIHYEGQAWSSIIDQIGDYILYNGGGFIYFDHEDNFKVTNIKGNNKTLNDLNFEKNGFTQNNWKARISVHPDDIYKAYQCFLPVIMKYKKYVKSFKISNIIESMNKVESHKKYLLKYKNDIENNIPVTIELKSEKITLKNEQVIDYFENKLIPSVERLMHGMQFTIYIDPGCDIYLASSSFDKEIKISDYAHLYLYKDDKGIYYALPNESSYKRGFQKHYLDDKTYLLFGKYDFEMTSLSLSEPVKYDNEEVCQVVRKETAKLGHTFTNSPGVNEKNINLMLSEIEWVAIHNNIRKGEIHKSDRKLGKYTSIRHPGRGKYNLGINVESYNPDNEEDLFVNTEKLQYKFNNNFITHFKKKVCTDEYIEYKDFTLFCQNFTMTNQAQGIDIGLNNQEDLIKLSNNI